MKVYDNHMTDWEKYEHVEQYLLLWIKQRSLDVYEYLKKEENREKLRSSNFNLQSMCQKLGMKKLELDMFFNEVCVISKSHKTKEVCDIIEEMRANKTPIKPTFSKEAVELQLAVEKMIHKKSEPAMVHQVLQPSDTKSNDEPVEPDEFAFYDSTDDGEEQRSNVLYDDDALANDDEFEESSLKQIIRNSIAIDEFEEAMAMDDEDKEDWEKLSPTMKTVIVSHAEAMKGDNEVNQQEKEKKQEETPIKSSMTKNKKKIEEDEVIVYDDEEPKEVSNKSKILKKILLFSFVAFVVVAGIVLLKHFGVISMILGTNKDTVPHIVKVEPSIPKENIPSFKKAPLPTPSDSYKTMQAQQDSSENNTTHTMSIITPIVPKTSEEPQTIAVPQKELLNEVNQSKESDERLNDITKKIKTDSIEKEKQKEPTKPSQPFPTTMQEFNNLFERHEIKALVDEEVVTFDGNKFKEGDDFGKSLRLIKIVDKNTVKILDISKNEIKRVTR